MERPATRADVLAGRTSEEEEIELLKASIEAAGGATVDTTEPAEGPIGGYAYPTLSADLDGDGNDESLLIQYAGDQYENRFVLAVDDGRILWRQEQAEYVESLGALPADLSSAPGTEVLLIGLQWSPNEPLRANLQAFGAHGRIWEYTETVGWFELNGLVQADQDASDEIAITLWRSLSPVSIRVFDGDGRVLRDVRPSLEETTSRTMFSEAFVTDGPQGDPDEAVFLTPFLAGYYAERRSLVDGVQTAVDVKINAEVRPLYQGPDFTGDGRRDALFEDYSGGPLAYSFTFGVFNGASFSTAWSHTSENGFAYYFPIGDADGDGGEDLCVNDARYEGDEPEETVSITVRCLRGATGAATWTDSRTVTGQYTYASSIYWSDLNADGVIDPAVMIESYTCSDFDCTTTSFESVAHSGTDGSTIWSTKNVDDYETLWGLSDTNLDGVPGHDALTYVWDETEPPDAVFSVNSGLTLAHSWNGFIETGELPGYVSGSLDPDLDGDGTSEVLVTAYSYEGVGERICEIDEWGEWCWYEDYNEYVYVAAFEPGGQLLWQLEL